MPRFIATPASSRCRQPSTRNWLRPPGPPRAKLQRDGRAGARRSACTFFYKIAGDPAETRGTRRASYAQVRVLAPIEVARFRMRPALFSESIFAASAWPLLLVE